MAPHTPITRRTLSYWLDVCRYRPISDEFGELGGTVSTENRKGLARVKSGRVRMSLAVALGRYDRDRDADRLIRRLVALVVLLSRDKGGR